MPGAVSPQNSQPTETPAERYQRIYHLYTQLNSELAELEKQGHTIIGEINAAIDKQKIDSILQKINPHKQNN